MRNSNSGRAGSADAGGAKLLVAMRMAGEDFRKDLVSLLALPKDTIAILADSMNDSRGFGFPSEADASAVLRKTGLSPDDSAPALKAAHFLFRQALEHKVGRTQLITALQDYATEHDIAGLPGSEDEVARLVLPVPDYAVNRQRRDYVKGVVPNLVGVSATHELRGIFEEGVPVCVTPILNVNIHVENPIHDEDTSLIFQVNENGLDELIRVFTKYRDQLRELKALVSPTVNVYEPPARVPDDDETEVTNG